jgi:hypothetical protein
MLIFKGEKKKYRGIQEFVSHIRAACKDTRCFAGYAAGRAQESKHKE